MEEKSKPGSEMEETGNCKKNKNKNKNKSNSRGRLTDTMGFNKAGMSH